MHSIPDNINKLRLLFREKLSQLYDQEEIDSIFTLVTERILKLDRTKQLIYSEDTIEANKILEFQEVLNRLTQNEPVQYIFGVADFYDLTFKVDTNVLIPRQETELLVDEIIKKSGSQELSILDIGTGSGCIAICLKKHLKNSQVTAIDISEKALAIAEKNAELNHVTIDFLHDDIFKPKIKNINYDIVVSNPPYVMEHEKSLMHKNVLDYEPELALFVPGSSALKYYEAIAKFCADHLKDSGSLWVEINETLGEETAELMHSYGLIQTTIIKDLNGKNRFIKADK